MSIELYKNHKCRLYPTQNYFGVNYCNLDHSYILCSMDASGHTIIWLAQSKAILEKSRELGMLGSISKCGPELSRVFRFLPGASRRYQVIFPDPILFFSLLYPVQFLLSPDWPIIIHQLIPYQSNHLFHLKLTMLHSLSSEMSPILFFDEVFFWLALEKILNQFPRF